MAALSRAGETPAMAFSRLPPFAVHHGEGLCRPPLLSTTPPALYLRAPSAPGLSGRRGAGREAVREPRSQEKALRKSRELVCSEIWDGKELFLGT